MALNETTIKLLTSLAIIVIGYLISKIGSSLILSLSKTKETISIKHVKNVKVFRYLIMIFTILAALIYLQVDLIKDVTIIRAFITNTYDLLPNILLGILLLVLALAVVNLIIFGLKRNFDAIGITEFMLEQKKDHFLNGILIFVRGILYLFTALFILNLFGINISGITAAIGWFFYGLMALIFLYIFFGTRTFVENFISGIYIKVSNSYKLGQKVKIGDIEGSIKSISHQSVTINSEFGYSTSIPNREFVNKEV